MSLHVPHPHAPHAPHADFDEHPWRMLPTALGVILVLAAVLIAVLFVVSKWVTGSAY